MAGCTTGPDSYPPPPQRPAPTAVGLRLGHFVAMNDPSADTYIVKDIAASAEGGSWRWAHRRPELRFFVETDRDWKFEMNFSIPEATLKDTGPVTLSVLIDGKLLGRYRYDRHGEKHLLRPVPPGLLKAGAINSVAIEPDRVWISTLDGAALSFILSSAGFVR